MSRGAKCPYPECTRIISVGLAYSCKMRYVCDSCSGVHLFTCSDHDYMVAFICPHYIACIGRTRDAISFLPHGFRDSAILGYSYLNESRIMLLLEKDIHIDVKKDSSVIRVFEPTGQNKAYTIETSEKPDFLDEYEQYTYKFVLNSLKSEARSYINILPRDITGIIRTFL